MAVNSNTLQTYGVTTLREELQDALVSISPTETPLMSAMGSKDVENTYYEWPVVALASASSSNRVVEGEASPGNDAATVAKRLGNYTQISDKVVEVSHTSDAVNGAGDVQKMAKQVALKLKELKRDMATMLVHNTAASAGDASTARQTAGLPTFLTTNVDRGSGATAPTLSGSTAGYPNAAVGNGTDRALTEAILKGVIAECWDAGANPSAVFVGSLVKQKISTFTGNATRYKEAEDKKLTAAIDIYVSDFGQLQIVPNRFQSANDVFVIDPDYVKVAWLQKTKQKPLAETGHSTRRLIWAEYGLQVDTEAAHGYISDIDGAL